MIISMGKIYTIECTILPVVAGGGADPITLILHPRLRWEAHYRVCVCVYVCACMCLCVRVCLYNVTLPYTHV